MRPRRWSCSAGRCRSPLCPALPRSRGRDWWPDESTRFGQLSRRLWDPILAAVEAGTAAQLEERRAVLRA